MVNMIVLHYLSGQIMKGSTNCFFANKNWFLFTEKDTGLTMKVEFEKLKGVFFVKDFDGSPKYQDRYEIGRPGIGTKIKVCFKDGEIIRGYTTGISPKRTGFFLFPSDPFSNTERVFAMNNATQDISFE